MGLTVVESSQQQFGGSVESLRMRMSSMPYDSHRSTTSSGRDEDDDEDDEDLGILIYLPRRNDRLGKWK